MMKYLALAVLAGGAVAGDVVWNATLHPQNNATVEGTADVRPVKPGDSTVMMSVRLRNTTAGTTYTSAIHNGTCASPGGIVGDGTEYPRVLADSTEVIRSESIVRVKPFAEGDHSVQVHAQPDRQITATTPLGPMVACGDLKASLP